MGYRFHTTKHEQIWPNQRTTNTGVFTLRDDGLEFFQLPVPNNEDYNIDPNTYAGEFFQEDGLQGSFQIDLTEAIGMEVDNESFCSRGCRG